ncbi:MAG TPA: DUF2334 domain-containing protein [Treponema sp.]|nr:DUF2334 domain-containing protein [Treponema sp.]HRS02871.1 DUF2334 domain-containing protein [Treponema sp.]HRU29498.1 DUF2334 domain-containing protein [Treponema sp.]
MKYATYLFRLDDACPYMIREKWEQLITLFSNYKVYPLVALIPDCQDPELKKLPYQNDFWFLIEKWQKLNIPIALHGYQHVFHKTKNNILSINDYSEFTGLSLQEQKDKIKKAYKTVTMHGIIPQFWVAPAHGFDILTLIALKEETPIRIISDGFSLYPYQDGEYIWVPQQLWKPRNMPFGVYTVCLHPNEMCDQDFIILENFLQHNYLKCQRWDEVSNLASHPKYFGIIENWIFIKLKIIKNTIKNIRRNS